MQGWADHVSKVAIVLAMIGFLATLAISYRSAGLAEGLTLGEIELDEFKASIGDTSKIHFAAHGEGTYVRFARDYGLMAWFLGDRAIVNTRWPISTAGADFDDWFSGRLNFLLLVLYKLRLLIRDKTLADDSFWMAPHNQFALQTITYDWLLVGLTCLLVLLLIGLLTIFVRGRLLTKRTVEDE